MMTAQTLLELCIFSLVLVTAIIFWYFAPIGPLRA